MNEFQRAYIESEGWDPEAPHIQEWVDKGLIPESQEAMDQMILVASSYDAIQVTQFLRDGDLETAEKNLHRIQE